MLLTFILFFFLPHWVFSTPCKESVSPGAVFVSFVKKHRGEKFKTELPANWTERIAESTRSWIRRDALQFLDFLINRQEEASALERIQSLADFPNIIPFEKLMSKVSLYDQIHTGIVDKFLEEGELFETLMTDPQLDEVKIRELQQFITSYIGELGASYFMRDFILYRAEELENLNLKEMKEVVKFVDAYTKEYELVTAFPEKRVSFFKQFFSLPYEQQRASQIEIHNFSELKIFSQLAFEELRKREKELPGIIEQKSYDYKLILMRHLQGMIKVKITHLFFALYNPRLSDLKKVVKILERYFRASEVAHILMSKVDIYNVNPKDLKEVINILEGVYNVPLASKEYRNKIINSVIDVVTPQLEARERRKVIKILNRTTEEFIQSIFKEKTDQLMVINPTHLKKTLAILKSYLGPEGTAFTLRIGMLYVGHQDNLLMINPDYLQRVIAVMKKYFEDEEMTHIVESHFSEMGIIKEIDAFTEIVEILRARIDQKSVFRERIKELFGLIRDFSPFDDEIIRETRDTLIKLSNTLDHRQLTELLTNTPVIEFSTTTQYMMKIIGDRKQSSSSLIVH